MSAPPPPSSATRLPGSDNSRKFLTVKPSATNVKFCLCWRSSGAEQLPCKQWVGGSNPPASAMAVRGAAARRAEPCTRDSRGSHRVPTDSGRYASGQRGQTVNLLAYAFGGSNPPLPTIVAGTSRSASTEGGLNKARLREARAVLRSRVYAAPRLRRD